MPISKDWLRQRTAQRLLKMQGFGAIIGYLLQDDMFRFCYRYHVSYLSANGCHRFAYCIASFAAMLGIPAIFVFVMDCRQ